MRRPERCPTPDNQATRQRIPSLARATSYKQHCSVFSDKLLFDNLILKDSALFGVDQWFLIEIIVLPKSSLLRPTRMSANKAATLGDEPPIYRIDLSLPPSERYIELASVYRDKLRALTGLFEQLVTSVLPEVSFIWVERAARLLLRRLYTREETEEIRGIAKVTGIDLYLLVALNVILDLLMGCTSGAALTQDFTDETARMLHFRTLDWDMDELRKLIVQLEFVRSPDTKTILATSITYVGFVGVLTGVRKGLSISLNYRPNHDISSAWRNWSFYASHLLVLLGVRRSISSVLRQCLIPGASSSSWAGWPLREKQPPPHEMTLDQITTAVSRIPTTAAYLIFCDGSSATTMEKDHRSAVIQSSSSFIVATNSDFETLDPSYRAPISSDPSLQNVEVGRITLVDVIADSNQRRACVQAHWDKKVQAANSLNNTSANGSDRLDPRRRTRASLRVVNPSPASSTSSDSIVPVIEVTATSAEIIRWTTTYPTTNEMTHFSTVMDPAGGKVFWVRRYVNPLQV